MTGDTYLWSWWRWSATELNLIECKNVIHTFWTRIQFAAIDWRRRRLVNSGDVTIEMDVSQTFRHFWYAWYVESSLGRVGRQTELSFHARWHCAILTSRWARSGWLGGMEVILSHEWRYLYSFHLDDMTTTTTTTTTTARKRWHGLHSFGTNTKSSVKAYANYMLVLLSISSLVKTIIW